MAPSFPTTAPSRSPMCSVPVCLTRRGRPFAGPDGLAAAAIRVADGRIAAIERRHPGDALLDGRGGIVFPAFVDCHTHLDKGHIWPRAQNPDGSFAGALESRDGGPAGEVEPGRRRRAHGVLAEMRLCARHEG